MNSKMYVLSPVRSVKFQYPLEGCYEVPVLEWAQWRKENSVRVEVYTAVTVKNGVLWDVTPCGSYRNQLFGGT
jgi:hypothetical protein